MLGYNFFVKINDWPILKNAFQVEFVDQIGCIPMKYNLDLIMEYKEAEDNKNRYFLMFEDLITFYNKHKVKVVQFKHPLVLSQGQG